MGASYTLAGPNVQMPFCTVLEVRGGGVKVTTPPGFNSLPEEPGLTQWVRLTAVSTITEEAGAEPAK